METASETRRVPAAPGQRLLTENASAGEALIRSFRVPESGETVGGNARVMIKLSGKRC